MTPLPFPKQLAEIDISDNEAIATCPFITTSPDSFVAGTSEASQGAYTPLQNAFSTLAYMQDMNYEPITALSLFQNPNGNTHGVLSSDHKFCYVHGSTNNISPFNLTHKINIATNEIVWTFVNPLGVGGQSQSTAIVLDNDGNVIVSSSILVAAMS